MVQKWLIHNGYVQFVETMLTEHFTQMCFDDYNSDLIVITNGIGQGCPLFMLLYLFYNTDICNILVHKYEDATCFVDGTSILATGKTFAITHKHIASMMSQRGSVTKWSKDHNPPWELENLEHIDYTRNNCSTPNPLLYIWGITIHRAASH